MVQPHVKGWVIPQKAFPFPWDKKPKPKRNVPKLTAEESKARFEKMAKRRQSG